ncbi:MAG: hypothetical protein N3B18_11550 [Desulfobacterota bacterium]|nr:hypothetical protein [Thermodesulfobacteriota bacterium]
MKIQRAEVIWCFSVALCMMATMAFAADRGGEKEFVPVDDTVVPVETQIVTLELRNTPLRDAIYSVAGTSGLNIVIEKGVNPEHPVTMSIKNVKADEAIRTILDSAGYFYNLEGNILTIKATDTKIYEFGHPPLVQQYAIDVGGDILGTAMENAREFSERSGGGGEGGGRGTGADDDLKGKVQQKIESDPKAFQFWDAVQNGLATILNVAGESQTSGAAIGENAPSLHINRMTGTIMVTAGKRDLERVERYLATLKNALNRQVIIEARVLEVTLSKGLKYGFDWSWIASGSTTIETNNFRSVVNPTSANVQIHVTTDDFTGVMRAIESQGDVKMLSNPRVNIMNGQSALLSVGRSQTFLAAIETNITNTEGNPIITYSTDTSSVLSGVMIGIVPYINEYGELSMSITPIISELIRFEERQIGKEGTMISLPTVDLRQLSTTVKVNNNEMIIIGGLVQTKRKKEDSQVPFVGNIPLIGYLFKRFDHSDEQTDIIILLKPQVRT